jgi:hypothetical protein
MPNFVVKLRNKLDSLQPGDRSLIRMLYPIVLYLLIHFTAVAAGITQIRPVQIGFMFVWAAVEYLLFLYPKKKRQ